MDEIEGTWWFGSEDSRYPGTLKIHSDKIELWLNQGVTRRHISDDPRGRHGDILGETSRGERVSLFSCSEIETSRSQSMYATARFRCGNLFLGIHHTSQRPARFTSIMVTLDLGSNWIGERPYNSQSRSAHNLERDFSIDFNLKSSLFKWESMGEIVELFFVNNPDFLSVSFRLESNLVLRVSNLGEPKLFPNWLSAIERYRWLLSLLMGQTMNVESIHLTAIGDEAPVGVSVCPPFTPGERRVRNIRPAISFSDLRSEFSDLLECWHSQAEKYASACALLLDQGNAAAQSPRLSFLLQIQILEALYRSGIYSRKDGKLLGEFAPVRDQLLAVVQSVKNADFIKHATQRINQMNELPLAKQLERFLGTFNAATVNAVGLSRENVSRIAEIRHDLTHVGRQGGGEVSALPEVIYEFSCRLRFLAFVYLLKEAGLNERDCVYHLGDNPEFRWLIDFSVFNDQKYAWAPEDYGHTSTGRFMRTPGS